MNTNVARGNSYIIFFFFCVKCVKNSILGNWICMVIKLNLTYRDFYSWAGIWYFQIWIKCLTWYPCICQFFDIRGANSTIRISMKLYIRTLGINIDIFSIIGTNQSTESSSHGRARQYLCFPPETKPDRISPIQCKKFFILRLSFLTSHSDSLKTLKLYLNRLLPISGYRLR